MMALPRVGSILLRTRDESPNGQVRQAYERIKTGGYLPSNGLGRVYQKQHGNKSGKGREKTQVPVRQSSTMALALKWIDSL